MHGAQDGAAQRDRIDPAVLVEVGVLGGDHRVDQIGGDLAERHAAAQPGRGVVGRQRRLQEAAIARVDARVLAVRSQRHQLIGRRQGAGHRYVAHGEHRQAQQQGDEEEHGAQQQTVEILKAAVVAGRLLLLMGWGCRRQRTARAMGRRPAADRRRDAAHRSHCAGGRAVGRSGMISLVHNTVLDEDESGKVQQNWDGRALVLIARIKYNAIRNM